MGFRNKRSIRVKRYNLQGQRWSHSNLTWSLRRTPRSRHVTRDMIRRELTYALRVWSRHTQLTFTETYDDENADIQIFFFSQYHGDGYPFDGAGKKEKNDLSKIALIKTLRLSLRGSHYV